MPADGATLAANADDLARLYDEYGAKIYRYCLGRLRSREDAEDAQQNTFLRVYTALRQGTVPAYEAAWLYKIAHNVCLSRVESGAARSRVETPRDLATLEAELAAPSGRRDELIGLEDALAELPANLRQAILLREWQGLSYTEIADVLGVSVSAVETLIFRARRRLAQTLEQGVARPAKRVASALNLPWVYDRLCNALRSLLSAGRVSLTAAGPAKIVAAAALVAAGGGGVGAGLALGTSHGTARPAPAASLPQAGSRLVTDILRGAQPAAGRRRPPAGPARAAGPTSLAGASGTGALQAPGVRPETSSAAPTAPPASGPPEDRPASPAGTPVAGTTPAAGPGTTAVSTTIASTTGVIATAAIPTVATPTTPTTPTVSAPTISTPELPSLTTIVEPAVVATTQAPTAVSPAAALPVAVLPLPAPVTTVVSPLHP